MADNTISRRNSPPPAPSQLWSLSEPPFEGFKPVDHEGFKRSTPETAIVIDNGSYNVRAGWSFDKKPRFTSPPVMARYRDRKINRMYTFVGSDIYSDGTARGQAKNVYEPGNNVINNWDVMEGVLDCVFNKLGIEADPSGGIGRPILMTEPAGNMPYSRKTMTEILFEAYGAPSVAYGIDSLFSYKYNNGRTGLVVSSSYTSTNIIPVVNSKAMLTQASRLNWGRYHTNECLLKLMKLKYPPFPGKITDPQSDDLVREHSRVSTNFDDEITAFLDWTGLEDRDRIVQHPYTEQVVVQKTEEELARAAEKRKESGRRLQEQAAKMRLEKLILKEQELAWYRNLQEKLANATTKKETKRLLDDGDFNDEGQLDKRVRELDKNIRKARNKDVGDVEEEEEIPTFPLLEIADDQLDEDQLKQKKQQRLHKNNYDARMRAKVEKEKERARIAEDERIDSERRETDLEGWIEEKRAAREVLVARARERERLKAELGNRKSMANQMRMKTIANLASDTPIGKKRRRGGGADDDDFGADDADWGVYRQVATGEDASDDEEEDLGGTLKKIEAQLLEHDPNFTEESTREAQTDWTKSLLHAFWRGPWPFDPELPRETHQLHLNVERIRIPEVVFQPNIAGVDQAGLLEVMGMILNERLADDPHKADMLKDIFLTGGNTMFTGFDERVRNELRALLPVNAELSVRRAGEPCLDAWKGAARWAGEQKNKNAFMTKAEWSEKGGDYLKEHDSGNIWL
ncbi:actin-like ATPase domain-containing protein [Eremomyces bilateralis CBS 781.70]|uniref:Actin-like ATPase domain-containing protein n=1 Tax=Eremomyces bilateralis CBS 781.70 TaxID=1392243 RepID=A0A6G1G4G5_9PEZI|nr:actin-like ATPase domain-containing protein [Eremomyces bilateralis CBS 781.70]KAF1812918.1 actin-like ATPase domain-containing protein [Eremomyces bilateralis CBS 781.70]